MNEIAAKEREAKELELAFENQQMEQLKLEEDEFQTYAEQVIQQAQKADRNVFPLKVGPNIYKCTVSLVQNCKYEIRLWRQRARAAVEVR